MALQNRGTMVPGVPFRAGGFLAESVASILSMWCHSLRMVHQLVNAIRTEGHVETAPSLQDVTAGLCCAPRWAKTLQRGVLVMAPSHGSGCHKAELAHDLSGWWVARAGCWGCR